MSTTLITKVSSIPYPYASQKSPRVHNLSPTHLTIVEFLSPPGYLCSCRVSSFPALYPPLLQATPSYLPPSVPAGTAPTRVPCDRPVSPLPWASAALLPSSSTGGPTLPPVVIVHRKSPLYIMSPFKVPRVLPPRHPRFNVLTHHNSPIRTLLRTTSSCPHFLTLDNVWNLPEWGPGVTG